MDEKNSRIGAILKANQTEVHLLGYGVYEGEFVPDEGYLAERGIKNPRLLLDNGETVWGYQCWWGPEEKVKNMIGNRTVINATISD